MSTYGLPLPGTRRNPPPDGPARTAPGVAADASSLPAGTSRDGADLRPVAQLDDDVLMRRCAEGDEVAFAEIYDRFAARVHGLARKVVRDPARAEEVVQEIFVEAWRTADRYDPNRGAVASWLLTMTHRRAVDVVRSEQAARNRDDDAGRKERDQQHDPVSERVETELEHEQVRSALDELTDLQRQAIELAYYGGRTYREVAELLEQPLGTVKSRLRTGLLKLRDVLEVGTS